MNFHFVTFMVTYLSIFTTYRPWMLSRNGVDASTSAEKAAMLNTFFGECFNSSLLPLGFPDLDEMASACFPTTWKMANIVPVLKSSNHSSPSNYRPISLLPTIWNIIFTSCSPNIQVYTNPYHVASGVFSVEIYSCCTTNSYPWVVSAVGSRKRGVCVIFELW